MAKTAFYIIHSVYLENDERVSYPGDCQNFACDFSEFPLWKMRTIRDGRRQVVWFMVFLLAFDRFIVLNNWNVLFRTSQNRGKPCAIFDWLYKKRCVFCTLKTITSRINFKISFATSLLNRKNLHEQTRFISKANKTLVEISQSNWCFCEFNKRQYCRCTRCSRNVDQLPD